MTKSLKLSIATLLIKIILYLITSAVLFLTIKEPKIIWIFPVSIMVAHVLSPRISEVKFQSEKKTQFKWIFMKRVVLF